MGRPVILDKKLVQKIADKLNREPLNVVKSASALARRCSVSSEVALILLAKNNEVGFATAQRKLSQDKQVELRSILNEENFNNVKSKRKSVRTSGISLISENEFKDPFLGNGLSKTSAEAYQILYILENSLRAFVFRVLSDNYGANWWEEIEKRKTTVVIYNKVAERKKSDSEDWICGKRGINEIYYTDYDHLFCIMRCFDKEFGPYFKKGPEKNLLGNLSSLAPTRNITAHNNNIVADDLKRLDVYAKEWLKYMRHLHAK